MFVQNVNETIGLQGRTLLRSISAVTLSISVPSQVAKEFTCTSDHPYNHYISYHYQILLNSLNRHHKSNMFTYQCMTTYQPELMQCCHENALKFNLTSCKKFSEPTLFWHAHSNMPVHHMLGYLNQHDTLQILKSYMHQI